MDDSVILRSVQVYKCAPYKACQHRGGSEELIASLLLLPAVDVGLIAEHDHSQPSQSCIKLRSCCKRRSSARRHLGYPHLILANRPRSDRESSPLPQINWPGSASTLGRLPRLFSIPKKKKKKNRKFLKYFPSPTTLQSVVAESISSISMKST